MDQAPDLVPRKARAVVAEALSDTRVVTLNGARQAGKSTLARLTVQADPNALIRLLDDPATLRAARDDPAGFVDHEVLLVIDEVQLAPELFRSIKATSAACWRCWLATPAVSSYQRLSQESRAFRGPR